MAKLDDSLLHNVVRAIAGGHDVGSAEQRAREPRQSALPPYAITEMVRRLNDTAKFEHVPGMLAYALNDATASSLGKMLTSLGISASRVSAVRRNIRDMDCELATGDRLSFACDSMYFLRFDNLGFKRGGKKASYFQTVTMHWEEVRIDMLKAILGRQRVWIRPPAALQRRYAMDRIVVEDGAGRMQCATRGAVQGPLRRDEHVEVEMEKARVSGLWARQPREEVVTREALGPSPVAWAALDKRLQDELAAAIDLYKLVKQGGVQSAGQPDDMCTKREFYGLCVGDSCSDEYLTFESRVLEEKIADGKVLDLFERNNMVMDEVMMNDLAKEVVVEAIQLYAQQRLDEFLSNPAREGHDVWAGLDKPSALAGIMLMCDGSPAAKIMQHAKDRVWNAMGPWHLLKEGFSTLCKLFDEPFYRDLVGSFRGEGPSSKGKQEWHMQCKGAASSGRWRAVPPARARAIHSLTVLTQLGGT